MRADNNIEKMIISQRLKLIKWHYLVHYAFVILILFPFILSFVDYIKYKLDFDSSVTTIEDVFLINWPFIIGAVILFLIQYSRLKFTILRSTVSGEKMNEICAQIANDNDWKIKIQINQMFQASAKGVFGDWVFVGEMITVLLYEDKIFINSICDPNEAPNIISLGNNKRHKKLILDEIKKASAQQKK